MVSVIIPAYNAERFIQRSVGSALNQTYSDVEVIVINDGSTDSTREKVEAMMESHSNLILVNTENGGVSRARNIGLDHAKGKYVTFLDADDMLFPDALERMVDCLRSSGGDFCATRAVRGENTPRPEETSQTPEIWDKVLGIKNVLADHPSVYSCWAKLYLAEKIKDIRFPEGMRVHEDSFFVFLCILSGMRLVKHDIYTYVYCENDQSATRSGFSEKVFDMLSLAKEKARLLRETYPELTDATVNVKIKAYMALLHNLCRTKDKKYRSYEKEAVSYIRKNKKYYIPCTKRDDQWFFIITHHLFGLYKQVYRIKFKV